MMIRLASTLFVLISIFFNVPAFATNPENKAKPIRIITNNWTSQIVLSHVTGRIFEEMGYKVEYSSLDIADQWGALAHGLAHVQVEVWEGTMSEMFNRMTDDGLIMNAGTHDAKTREEWWYPKYVEDLCPGLPDWKALKKMRKNF